MLVVAIPVMQFERLLTLDHLSADMDVLLTTVTLLTVTPIPLTATVASETKFVPVSV